MPVFCPDCTKLFRSNYELNRHKQSKKSCIEKEGKFSCFKCNYRTDDKAKLERHLARKNPCDKNTLNSAIKINERLDEIEEKHRKEIQKLKQKINKQNRPINYNFIINNFNEALNIEDCLTMENVTKDIMDKCKKVPLKDGCVYVLDSLCDIDPQIRPFHCTDGSRQKFIVRSDDNWHVDNNGTKIKSHMNPVVSGIYNEVYRDKMAEAVNPNDKLKVMDDMKELISDNVNKSCNNAVKASTTKYSIKNIDDKEANKDNMLTNVVDIDDFN